MGLHLRRGGGRGVRGAGAIIATGLLRTWADRILSAMTDTSGRDWGEEPLDGWRAQLRRGTARHTCAWNGCCLAGEYRAPRSREHLREFIWLCLEHVREYNRGWDYFSGMSMEQIDAHRRDDMTWHRPTWRPQERPAPERSAWQGPDGRFRDPFDLLRDRAPGGGPFGGQSRQWTAEPPGFGAQARAMANVLELEPGFTLVELKARYKQLVKQHHPDLHGGDIRAQDRLRRIIEAYRHLVEHKLYR